MDERISAKKIALIILGAVILGFYLTKNPEKKYEPDFKPDLNSSVYKSSESNRYGLPDGVGLSGIFPTGADDIPSSEPLTMVALSNGKAALADKKGEVVLKTNYDWIGNFHDGLALVEVEGNEDMGGPAKNKWGYINIKGQEVISLNSRESYPFSEGLALFHGDKGLFGFFDTQGKIVIKAQYDDAEGFLDGTAQVKLNNIWIRINRKGEKVSR